MILTITGTPGVGKTYTAKKLAGKSFEYFDLNKYIKEEKIFEKYDKTAKTYDVDIKRLRQNNYLFENNLGIKKSETKKNIKKYFNKKVTFKELKKIISKEEGIIIDSHLSQYLNSDLCIVIQSDIKKIKQRLLKRKYPTKKIEDNIQSEIFEICLEEARKQKRDIIILTN